jgi:hypothetical protein
VLREKFLPRSEFRSSAAVVVLLVVTASSSTTQDKMAGDNIDYSAPPPSRTGYTEAIYRVKNLDYDRRRRGVFRPTQRALIFIFLFFLLPIFMFLFHFNIHSLRHDGLSFT